MKKELITFIRTVAPTVATAFGGPLAGMATRAVSQALLGKPDADTTELEAALAGASPSDLLKLKELETSFKLEMERLGVDLERVHAGDRDSARKRQIALKDATPGILGVVSFAGFFGILVAFMFLEVPDKSMQPLLIMLGALASIVIQVTHYYFGSSKGSADKSKAMERGLR